MSLWNLVILVVLKAQKMCRMKDRKHMKHKKSLLLKSGSRLVYYSSCSVWKHETWYSPSLRRLQKRKKELHTSRLALSTRENQEAFQMHALVFVYAEDTYLDIVIPAWLLAKNFLFVIYWEFVEGCSLKLKGRLESRSKLTYHTCGFSIILSVLKQSNSDTWIPKRNENRDCMLYWHWWGKSCFLSFFFFITVLFVFRIIMLRRPGAYIVRL